MKTLNEYVEDLIDRHDVKLDVIMISNYITSYFSKYGSKVMCHYSHKLGDYIFVHYNAVGIQLYERKFHDLEADTIRNILRYLKQCFLREQAVASIEDVRMYIGQVIYCKIIGVENKYIRGDFQAGHTHHIVQCEIEKIPESVMKYIQEDAVLPFYLASIDIQKDNPIINVNLNSPRIPEVIINNITKPAFRPQYLKCYMRKTGVISKLVSSITIDRGIVKQAEGILNEKIHVHMLTDAEYAGIMNGSVALRYFNSTKRPEIK